MKKSLSSLFLSRNVILGSSFLLLLAFALSNCNTGAKPVATGRELYISYCAICHGDDGKGAGSMTEYLKLPPADLTMIAARRGGNYPAEEIYQIIDGRVSVAGHGSGDMPIWGPTLKASETLNNEKEVRESINNLVDYLKSIQE